MEVQTQLIDAIQQLHNEVKELRETIKWQQLQHKPWLTSKEAAEILGFPQKTARQAMSGLDNVIVMKKTRPKLYLATDVYKLLKDYREGRITFITQNNQKFLRHLS